MTTNETLRELLRDIENYLDRVGEFDQTYRPGTRPTNTPAELLLRLRAALAEPSAAPARVVMPKYIPRHLERGIHDPGWNDALDEVARLNASPTVQSETETQRSQAAYNAVIDYMLGEGYMESPMEFLRCWNEGNFDALRKEWPDAPIAIYYADPLADHEDIDAKLHAELDGTLKAQRTGGAE